MTRAFSRPANLIYLIVLGLLASLHGTETDFDPASVFDIEIRDNHSQINFHAPQGWECKLLNESPAGKIVMKLTGSDASDSENLVSETALPGKGSILRYHLTPLSPRNRLLVFDLEEALDFEWQATGGGCLVVHDEKFFDKSEWEYRRGLKLQKEGKKEQALAAFRKAVFLNRSNGNAYFKAGQIRLANQQYRLAEIDFKHALRLSSDSLDLYLALRDLYQAKGDPESVRKYEQIYRQKTAEQMSASTAEDKFVVPIQTKNTEQTGSHRVVASDAAASPDTAATLLSKTEPEGWSPSGTIFYLLGIAFLLVFAVVILSLLGLRKRHADAELMPDLPEIQLQYQKDKILKAARKIVSQSEADPGDSSDIPPVLDDANEQQSADERSMEHTRSLMEEGEYADEEEPVDHRWDGSRIARELNLGVGEIELALNMTAHQRQAQKFHSLDNEIEALYEQNMDVTEIARHMSLGQGEVELLLAMRKQAAVADAES